MRYWCEQRLNEFLERYRGLFTIKSHVLGKELPDRDIGDGNELSNDSLASLRLDRQEEGSKDALHPLAMSQPPLLHQLV